MARYKKIKNEIPSQYFWDLDDQKKIHVTRITDEVRKDLILAQPHRLGHYSVRYFHQGSGMIYIDHIAYEIRDNWTMLATPDQISWVDIAPGTFIDMSVIAFNQHFIDLMGFPPDTSSLVFGKRSHVHGMPGKEESERILRYIELISLEFTQEQQNRDLVLASLTKALLLQLVKVVSKDATRVNRDYMNIYREFLSELKENFLKLRNVSEYTEKLGISEKRLNRACRAVTDLPASVIIRQHLGFEAKRLLYYSSNTVKEISYHLGFHDPAHFNKFFRNLYGYTPGSFRSRV